MKFDTKNFDKKVNKLEKLVSKRSLPLTKGIIKPLNKFVPKGKIPTWNEGFNE